MRFNHLRSRLSALVLALTSSALASTTWYVNGLNGSNSNNCLSRTTACKTISHAISLAASGDTIRVASATYLESLHLHFSLNLIGSGANTAIIDGGSSQRVVTISSTSAKVTLRGFAIRNGQAPNGGGVYNRGTLIIIDSTVSGNVAFIPCSIPCIFVGGKVLGGGLYNSGAVTINSSTFSGNGADFPKCTAPPCVAAGGGIYNVGELTINNSTFSANGAFVRCNEKCSSFGGGINGGGKININNSSFSGNSAAFANCTSSCGAEGGAIYGAATLQNNIVANSTSGGNCYGTMTSLGYNLSSDGTCNFDNAGDLNNTNPLLGPLQNNGGPTQTMALPSGSPAIDAGNPSGCKDSLGHLLKTDQRGKPRPDAEDTGGCDMGAYERQSD